MIQIFYPAGSNVEDSLRDALRFATRKLRAHLNRSSPRAAYAPGGQTPGPFRIKSAKGTPLATCTIGVRTTNPKRAKRAPNEQMPYVRCNLTPEGKRKLTYEHDHAARRR